MNLLNAVILMILDRYRILLFFEITPIVSMSLWGFLLFQICQYFEILIYPQRAFLHFSLNEFLGLFSFQILFVWFVIIVRIKESYLGKTFCGIVKILHIRLVIDYLRFKKMRVFLLIQWNLRIGNFKGNNIGLDLIDFLF